MEPFGLLNFLKTLLPQTETSTQNGAGKEDKNGGGSEGILDGNPPSTDNGCPPLPDAKNNPPPFSDVPQNAFLDFVSRHEERKKNIKKP